MGNCGKTCGNYNCEKFNRNSNFINNAGKIMKDKLLFKQENNQQNLNNQEKKMGKCKKNCKKSILRRNK
jgi:hypothetical protein